MNIRVTWCGHATVLVEDVARILTDPVLTSRLLHLHRRSGPDPDPSWCDVDAALVSHIHADHLHRPSLGMLASGTPVVVPLGAAGLLRGLPIEPVEVVVGDVLRVAGASVMVVPAAHADARWPGGRTRAAAVGYVIAGSGATYFAGDTVAFSEMSNLRPALDLALLPVGGWGPWLRGEHLDAKSAAACLPVLDARVSVPIHYGTFWPVGLKWLRRRVFHEPGRDFASYAREVAPGTDVRVLAPGGSTEVALR